jgi:hypothetical protein
MGLPNKPNKERIFSFILPGILVSKITISSGALYVHIRQNVQDLPSLLVCTSNYCSRRVRPCFAEASRRRSATVGDKNYLPAGRQAKAGYIILIFIARNVQPQNDVSFPMQHPVLLFKRNNSTAATFLLAIPLSRC